MPVHILIHEQGISEVNQRLRLLPVETRRAVRLASVKTGTYLRQQAKGLMRNEVKLKSEGVKSRVRGNKRYVWLGGNSVPLTWVKQLIRKSRSSAGGYRVGGVYYAKSWIDRNGHFWHRLSDNRKDIERIVYHIAPQVYKVGDRLQELGGPKLLSEFQKAADDIIIRGRADRDPTTFKGKTTDSLSGIKFIRTNIR